MGRLIQLAKAKQARKHKRLSAVKVSPFWLPSALGKALEAYRLEHLLSLQEVSKLADISASTLCRVENGRMPDLPTFVKLRLLLQLPADVLLGVNIPAYRMSKKGQPK